MVRLTPLTYRQIESRLLVLGYRSVRQRGSHVRFELVDAVSITLPKHALIGRGLLRKIIRDLGLSVEEFLNLGK